MFFFELLESLILMTFFWWMGISLFKWSRNRTQDSRNCRYNSTRRHRLGADKFPMLSGVGADKYFVVIWIPAVGA